MIYSGVVYELKPDAAVVLTKHSYFIEVIRRNEMYVGQKISFLDSDVLIRRKGIGRNYMIAAGIAAMLVLTWLFFLLGNSADPKVFAYISIDVNPSLEMSVDKNQRVLRMEAVNPEASSLVGSLDIEGANVETAVESIFKKIRELNFIDKNSSGGVLISAALNESYAGEEEQLESILRNCRTPFDQKKFQGISPVFLKTTYEQKVSAAKHRISMGKYELYTRMVQKGLNISLEDMKGRPIHEILEESRGRIQTDDVRKDLDSGSTPGKNPTPGLTGAPTKSPQGSLQTSTPGIPAKPSQTGLSSGDRSSTKTPVPTAAPSAKVQSPSVTPRVVDIPQGETPKPTTKPVREEAPSFDRVQFQSNHLVGKVRNLTPLKYRMAVYIFVPDWGWVVKPHLDQKITEINPDGSFTCNIITGGRDEQWQKAWLFVYPKEYDPPAILRIEELPGELFSNAYLKLEVARNQWD